MQTNRTKLTDEELRKALSLYSGVRTVHVKQDLERLINFVYNIGVEHGKRSIDEFDEACK